MQSWRVVPKVEVFVLRFLHRANALQVRQRRGRVRGHKVVTSLVSKVP